MYSENEKQENEEGKQSEEKLNNNNHALKSDVKDFAQKIHNYSGKNNIGKETLGKIKETANNAKASAEESAANSANAPKSIYSSRNSESSSEATNAGNEVASATSNSGQAAAEGGEAAAEGASSAAEAGGATAEAGGAAAAEVGAGAATGGIGAIVIAGLKVAKDAIQGQANFIKKTSNDMQEALDNRQGDLHTGDAVKLAPFIIPAAIIICITCGTSVISNANNMISPIVSSYGSENFDETTYGKNSNKLFGNIFSWFSKVFSDDEEDDLDDFVNEKTFVNSATREKEIVDTGFENAIELAKKQFKTYLKAENKRRKQWNSCHDEENQLPIYDENRSLASLDEYTWENVYKNVNYAELFTIAQQNDGLTSTTARQKTYKNLFKTDEQLEKLYRMRKDDVTDDDGVFYLKATIVQYTLQGLYDFYSVDAYADNNTYKNTQNIDMLDASESVMREYMSTYFDFGTSLRTDWTDNFLSMDYNEMIAWVNSQLESQYTNGQDADATWDQIQSIIGNEDLSEAQKKIIEYALSKLGIAYSQGNRMSSNAYDCSSFVARVYAACGYKFYSSSAPVAADECKMFESWGAKVSASDIQPGDVIFYSTSSNGRYKNVTHTAIYIGNGMQVAARGVKYGVDTNSASLTSAVSICRPLAYYS